MNLSHFALARDPFKHIEEEVPTHFPRVGRISGCVKKLCIPQTSRNGKKLSSGSDAFLDQFHATMVLVVSESACSASCKSRLIFSLVQQV